MLVDPRSEHAHSRIKVLLLSHRNPSETNLSLMEQMTCNKLFYVAELAPVLNGLKAIAADKISYTSIPSFDTMLEGNPSHYIFEETIDTSEDSPIVIFHSSGSTGMSFHKRRSLPWNSWS